MSGFQAHHTILIALQIFGISLIGVLFFIAYQRKLARRHEFSRIFLEKLSSEEFVDLLKSSAGRRSVERVLGTYKPASEWITDAIRRSVILIFVGTGLVTVYFVAEYYSGSEILLIVGGLAISIAIGTLVAAALTHGRARREDETAL